MSMDLINFVFGAATGVAGNSVYDSIKLILGNKFGQLETVAENDNRGKFEFLLQTVLANNETIKEQLQQLHAQELGQQTGVNIKGDVKAGTGSVAAGVVSGTITLNNTLGGDGK